MSFVDGVVLGSPALVSDPAIAAHTTEILVDTLVALHSVDPQAVGLADFGKPEGIPRAAGEALAQAIRINRCPQATP